MYSNGVTATTTVGLSSAQMQVLSYHRSSACVVVAVLDLIFTLLEKSNDVDDDDSPLLQQVLVILDEADDDDVKSTARDAACIIRLCDVIRVWAARQVVSNAVQIIVTTVQSVLQAALLHRSYTKPMNHNERENDVVVLSSIFTALADLQVVVTRRQELLRCCSICPADSVAALHAREIVADTLLAPYTLRLCAVRWLYFALEEGGEDTEKESDDDLFTAVEWLTRDAVASAVASSSASLTDTATRQLATLYTTPSVARALTPKLNLAETFFDSITSRPGASIVDSSLLQCVLRLTVRHMCGDRSLRRAVHHFLTTSPWRRACRCWRSRTGALDGHG
eukprot:PhM_4_TR18838/c2_g1_i1/m.39722